MAVIFSLDVDGTLPSGADCVSVADCFFGVLASIGLVAVNSSSELSELNTKFVNGFFLNVAGVDVYKASDSDSEVTYICT